MQTEPAVRQVLADDRHLQVAGPVAAVLGRERPPQPAGRISGAAHLTQQVLPLLAWYAVVLEVGSSPLPAVVEEPHVVVALLERNDLGLDERIEPVERVLDGGRDRKVHECTVGA